MPRPPVIGPLILAAGPGGAGARVVGVAGVAFVDEVVALGDEECDDDEHPETSVTTATAALSITDVGRRIGRSLARRGFPGSVPASFGDLAAGDGPPTLHRVTEYADPDLETIAPLPPSPPSPPLPMVEPVPPHRGSAVGVIVGLIVVSLVVGFGTATVVLNARDSTPTAIAGTPTPPVSPVSNVLDRLVLQQSDVPLGDRVIALDRGADLTVATLDLCNGTYPSEKLRVARRQVVLVDELGLSQLSTEAVLYGKPADGVQAFRELRTVAAHCPANPVKSPVGEDTTTTKFRTAPDGSWPRTPTVERLAFDFDSTDAASGERLALDGDLPAPRPGAPWSVLPGSVLAAAGDRGSHHDRGDRRALRSPTRTSAGGGHRRLRRYRARVITTAGERATRPARRGAGDPRVRRRLRERAARPLSAASRFQRLPDRRDHHRDAPRFGRAHPLGGVAPQPLGRAAGVVRRRAS